MSVFLNIWFIGVMIFLLFIIFDYRYAKERISNLGTLFIMILWPITVISFLFLAILIWIEEKNKPNNDFYIHVVIKNKEDAKK